MTSAGVEDNTPRFAVGVEFLKLTAVQREALEAEVVGSLFMI